MNRERQVLIVGAILLAVAVGVVAYPYLYSYLFPLPTSIILSLTPTSFLPSVVRLKDSMFTVVRQSDNSVLFTYTKDFLLNVSSCKNFPYKMWNVPADRPAKYTEVIFSSPSFSDSATLLMCDNITINFNKTWMLNGAVDVTITEAIIGA